MQHNFRMTVARSPEDVFDFLVDLRNAPHWEPNCQAVEKTSDGPIGKDTTFLAKKRDGPAQVGDRRVRAPVAFRHSRHRAQNDLRLGLSLRREERRHGGPIRLQRDRQKKDDGLIQCRFGCAA